MRRLFTIAIVGMLLLGSSVFAQGDPIRLYGQANEYRLLSDFIELVKLPNAASDTENV